MPAFAPHGLLCSFLLGLGQLCMFTGFDSQSFIVEPVMHSVNARDPSKISAHAGYYGSALIYCFFTVGNLFAPWIMHHLGSRLTLALASSMFTLYFCSFFYIHFALFYATSALMGIGFAMFYMGEGGYLMEHSSRRTIERNSALAWAIGTMCMIIGGIVMLFTIKPSLHSAALNSTTNDASTGSTVIISSPENQNYSDRQIRLMYGAFALIALISNGVFLFLPRKIDPRSLAGLSLPVNSFYSQFKSMMRCLVDPNIMQLAPFFSLLGSQGTFWMGVYPTTLTFSAPLAAHIYLPAYYSIVLGCGETLMGLSVSFLSRRYNNFAQRPTLAIGATCLLSALTLTVLSTPAHANTVRGQSADSLCLQPSFSLSLLIALLFGCSDCCLNTVRTVTCSLILPDQRTEVFSISKLYQSLTCCILYFISSFISVPLFIFILMVKTVIAAMLYFRVLHVAKVSEHEATLSARVSAAKDSLAKLPFRVVIGLKADELNSSSTSTACLSEAGRWPSLPDLKDFDFPPSRYAPSFKERAEKRRSEPTLPYFKDKARY